MADANPIFLQAVQAHQAGDLVSAEAGYRTALVQDSAFTPAWCNLGALLAKLGRNDEADNCYRQALAAAPNQPDTHYNYGNLLRRVGRFQEAIQQYMASLKLRPAHANTGYNLGLAFLAIGELNYGTKCFEDVLQLDPTFADAHARLGDALIRAGKPAEAVAHFRQFIAMKPDDPRGPNNVALALSSAGQFEDAAKVLQEVISKFPQYAEAHNTLGVTMEALGQKDEAQAHYAKAVELKPDFADAWSNRGINLLEQGRADDAIECLRKSIAIRPGAAAVYSNLLLSLNYTSRVTPKEVATEHRTWGEYFGKPVYPRPAITNPDPNRILRIGYISADFKGHTVAGLIETFLTHHDRSQFHVTAYANVFRSDETTERLKTKTDTWRSIQGESDDSVAKRIHEDQIDILVDLSGHTAGNRLLVLARRQAPLQLTMFGYPNTTGLSSVDFRVSDAISDPPEHTEFLYTERILRLPHLAYVYTPPAEAGEVGPLPCTGRRPFTFGCLNNPGKISDACLKAWANVMNELPGSRFVLLAGQSSSGAAHLADRFTKAGIHHDRVEMVFRLPRDQYYDAYQLFDLTLDPFPYNGGITTFDSLWMGVPALTVAGSSYVSRQGLAIMCHLGLVDFVAKSPEDLVTVAKNWNTRKSELALIRKGLRERLQATPLCNGKAFVGEFETALRDEWQKLCQQPNRGPDAA